MDPQFFISVGRDNQQPIQSIQQNNIDDACEHGYTIPRNLNFLFTLQEITNTERERHSRTMSKHK